MLRRLSWPPLLVVVLVLRIADASSLQYYETAANLGDTGMLRRCLTSRRHELTMFAPSADAMNEVAWCYLEGFGTKKDKVSPFSHPSPGGARRPLPPCTPSRAPSNAAGELSGNEVLPAGQVACSVDSPLGNGGHNATCLSHHGWLAFRWIRELGINEAFWSQREWDRRVEPFPLHRSHAIIVSGFEKKDRSVI